MKFFGGQKRVSRKRILRNPSSGLLEFSIGGKKRFFAKRNDAAKHIKGLRKHGVKID